MEHIRLYDWCTTQPDIYFLNERDVDNCVTEKILRNKFTDPTVSSDEEEQPERCKINWDEVFKKKQVTNSNRKEINVPGMRMPPLYPKLSALTHQQHYQCLKVLCAENPGVLETEFMARPTKQDHKVFEEVKEAYLREQKEYKEWAKQLWITSHCLRALRPKPAIEMVYDAEFKVNAQAMKSFPKSYELAAQIPLQSKNANCDLVFSKDIVKVDTDQLPEVQIPSMTTKKMLLLSETAIPEPCAKHPCRIILPNEPTMTILPLPEVHRELAQFSSEYDAHCIMSEGALRCIIEQSRPWELALSVCEVVKDDGDTVNVIVISNEFTIEKQPAQTRTYRAYRHLLNDSLIPYAERQKQYTVQKNITKATDAEQTQPTAFNMDDSSDEENENSLVIDTGEEIAETDPDIQQEIPETSKDTKTPETMSTTNVDKEDILRDNNKTTDERVIDASNNSIEPDLDRNQIGMYNCTCKDTIFEIPPPRSYRMWRVNNPSTRESYNLVIHCSHKTKSESNEVILEPIIEYQIDLGGSKQSDEKLLSLAMSLQIRDNARLVNARLDGPTGELVTIDQLSLDDLKLKHNIDLQLVGNYVYTIINQLQGLLPGQYILHHDATLGSNAFLYAPKNTGADHKLQLDFNKTQLGDNDEARLVKTAPDISDDLLPYHKFRKILPCAFTSQQGQVLKESKKQITKHKAPPRAALWPKKKKKGKGKQ